MEVQITSGEALANRVGITTVRHSAQSRRADLIGLPGNSMSCNTAVVAAAHGVWITTIRGDTRSSSTVQ